MAATPKQAGSRLAVEVVSDVVCPWCYLGKRRLETAVGLAPDADVTIAWRPFRLDPTIPAGGIPRRDYLVRKFGSADGLDAAHANLSELGAAEGIDFRFDRITRSPNTLDAHRLVRWASGEGVADDVVESLFRGYFVDGLDIGSHGVLAAIAAEAGMDGAGTAARLASDEDRAEVEADIAHAYRIGVSGVPCFIIDKRYAIVGAQTPEALARAFDAVVREAAGRPS